VVPSPVVSWGLGSEPPKGTPLQPVYLAGVGSWQGTPTEYPTADAARHHIVMSLFELAGQLPHPCDGITEALLFFETAPDGIDRFVDYFFCNGREFRVLYQAPHFQEA
jgi:hypothetical protein